MTRTLTRTNFHSSSLIRFLCDIAILKSAEPVIGFAEKLGMWLNLNDAISLYAVHNASTASSLISSSGIRPVMHAAALEEEFTRMRTSLVKLISRNTSSDVSRKRLELHPSKPGVPIDLAAAYETYRRYYLAQQRDIELKVRPLRTQAREVLARTSPTLKKLAALDAALDEILSDRESKLLTTVVALLEKRFTRLFKAHQQSLVAAQLADNPDSWMRPGGWLADFCKDMQTALLAELDARLQPTLGLIEALNNEISQH